MSYRVGLMLFAAKAQLSFVCSLKPRLYSEGVRMAVGRVMARPLIA